MKRFYKEAASAAVDGGFEVRLDGRSLRSPAKAPLILPTGALADAIAAEWQEQGEQVIPDSMVLMQLAATAVDVVAVKRAEIVAGVAKYAETDLLCYRAEHPEALVERQNRHWQPLLDWATHRFDASLHIAAGLMPRPQPADALHALERAVDSYGHWHLSALQSATASCGSLIVALALAEGRVSADEAFDISQIDETFQIEKWGEDAESTRRRAGLRRDIGAAGRFLALLG